jgi:hypothetical protein
MVIISLRNWNFGTFYLLLFRSGIINVIEEESPPPPPKSDDKDPFNISNDEYYAPKTQDNLIKVATGGGLLQHATPVVELQVPFVPTHMGPIKLRAFHRPPLKRYSHGALADYTRFVVATMFLKLFIMYINSRSNTLSHLSNI